VTKKRDPESIDECDRLHIDSFELREVVLPTTVRQKSRKAISITIRGSNFRAVAQPLVAFVGEIPVRYIRIAPDEQSITGILLEEPTEGMFVDVILGDEHVRHSEPFLPSKIKRI
jgi:hypothetical protein